MSAFISIVMAVYNNEKYFPKAVKSVLEQSFRDIELIIVDDGSTDQTPFLADQFAEADSRVQVIHQENQWIYASFNRGVAAAKGEYVYILNSDDLLREGALELIAQKARQYNPDVIWTKVLSHVCDDEQRILSYDYRHSDRLVQRELYCKGKDAVRKNWILLIKNSLAANQANLYRRELMEKHPFRNDTYGGDVFFNISIAPDVESFYVCQSPVYDFLLYRTARGNASHGRYYGYEHKMFNEFYINYKKLYESWGIDEDSVNQVFASMRIKYVSVEIQSLTAHSCPLTVNEKINRVFTESVDDLVYHCALEYDRLEELEMNVVAGARGILGRESLKPEDSMFFISEMLDSMIRYEKGAADLQRLEAGVSHELNPYHIGQCLLNRLRRQKHLEAETKGGLGLVLYGAGMHGRTYLPELEKEWEILGYCDKNPEKDGGSYCGKPVFGLEGLKALPRNVKVFIAVSDREARKEIHRELDRAGVKTENILEEIL